MDPALKSKLIELIKFKWKDGEEHPLDRVVDAVAIGLHQLNYRIVHKDEPGPDHSLIERDKRKLVEVIEAFVKPIKAPPKDFFPTEELAIQILKRFAIPKPKPAAKKAGKK